MWLVFGEVGWEIGKVIFLEFGLGVNIAIKQPEGLERNEVTS